MILGHVSCETRSKVPVPSGKFRQAVPLSLSLAPFSVCLPQHHGNDSLRSCSVSRFFLFFFYSFFCPPPISLYLSCRLLDRRSKSLSFIYGLLILSFGTVRHYLFLVVAPSSIVNVVRPPNFAFRHYVFSAWLAFTYLTQPSV